MRRPLPPLARAALLSGVALLAGLAFQPGRAAALALAICGLALAVTAMLRAIHPAAPWVGLAAAALALGGAAARQTRLDCRLAFPDDARLRLVGAPEAEPASASGLFRIDAVAMGRGGVRPGPGGVRLRNGGASTRGAVVGERREGASWIDGCAGTVRVRWPRRSRAPHAGRSVVAWGRWRRNPPLGGLLPRPAMAGTLFLDSVRVPASGEGDPRARRHTVLGARGMAQRRLRQILGRRAATAEALLLARREGLDAEERQRFADAGLAHVLAISGLHVGVVAAALLVLGRVARLAPAPAALLAGGATILYVAFLGAPYAAARAAAQVLLILLARLLQRPSDAFALLAAAALALLALDPAALLDAGFQLSFAGTGAIVAFRRPLLERIPRRVPATLADGLATGAVAFLATTPVAALHFGRAAPVGLLASLLAVPIVALTVPATALALLASGASASFGRFLGGGAALGLGALERVARLAAEAPGGHFTVPGDVALGALCAMIGAAVALRSRRLRPRVGAIVAVGFAIDVFSAGPLVERIANGGALDIYMIDVGQGDAIAIRTPRGRWILVDTGPATPTFDAGRSRVVPFLLRHGGRGADLLVLTHPDGDHIGGAAAVLHDLRVGAVLDPAVPAGKARLRDALHAAGQDGARWYRALRGEELALDGVRLAILAPARASVDDPVDANENSIVFRLSFGRFAAIFDGDAPSDVEEDVVRARRGSLAAAVLKVGHHGSRTSSSEAFLDAVRPRVALVSVGRHNHYGHPSPEVIERLRRHGIEVHRTDREGTVRVRAWADGRVEVVR